MNAIVEQVLSQVTRAMHGRSDDMLVAWNKNMEEATENDDKLPALKLTVGVTIDLEKGSAKTVLGFTVAYRESICEPLPDPNQPLLPGVNGGAQ